MGAEHVLEKLKFKVSVLGDPNVGKTSLIHHFCEGFFRESYLATIGSIRLKKSGVIAILLATSQLLQILSKTFLRDSIIFDRLHNVSLCVIGSYLDVIILSNGHMIPF